MTKARSTGVALALIALLAAPAACGRYGEPTRTRPGANAARGTPAPPVLGPEGGSGENAEECPPDAQQTDEQKARTP